MTASTAVMLSVALALVLGAQGQATFNLVSSTACSATAKVANVTQLKAQALNATTVLVTFYPPATGVCVSKYTVLLKSLNNTLAPFTQTIDYVTSGNGAESSSALLNATFYNLTSNQTYGAQVFVTSIAQEKGPTSTTIVAMPPACANIVPPAPVEALAATLIGTTAITISWNRPASNPCLSHYRVLVRGVSAQGPVLATSAVDSSPSQFTYTYSLTGLQPASAYYFTVVPDVDAAEKNVGNATGLAVTTAPPVTPTCQGPPGKVTGLTGSATSPTSVVLQWGSPGGVCPVNGYLVQYSQVMTGGVGAGPSTTQSASVTTLSISGLAAGATYRFVVSAFNSFGNGEAASSLQISLPQAPPPPSCTSPPGPVLALTASAISQTSAQVGWNVPNQGCGSANINYYTYQVVPVGLVAASRQMTQTNDINIVITSLTPGSTYQIIVNAVNQYGSSPSSSVYLTMPNTCVPGAVRNLKGVPNSSANGATITWTAPSGSCPAVSYLVSYGQPGVIGLPAPQTVYGTSVSYNTWQAGATYVVTVTAQNNNGVGPPSSVTVQVPPYATGLIPPPPPFLGGGGSTNAPVIGGGGSSDSDSDSDSSDSSTGGMLGMP